MIAGTAEQRNPYKGSPSRPWIRLRLVTPDGAAVDMQLLADTGNPCAVIIGQTALARLKQRAAPSANSNFGPLDGGWLRVNMHELGLDQDLIGYASDAVVGAAKASSPDFEGLAGLPLLRLAEFGGDANWFWFRSASPSP